jgi:hypothetical protein
MNKQREPAQRSRLLAGIGAQTFLSAGSGGVERGHSCRSVLSVRGAGLGNPAHKGRSAVPVEHSGRGVSPFAARRHSP